MIKDTEIRKGNWLISARGIPQKVAYVGETIGFYNEAGGTDKHQKNPIISFDIDKIKGIELTPEIMVKCGFDLFPWGYVKISSKDFGVRINLHTFNYDVSGNSPVKIKYLHRLQNLWQDLTGEELII